MTAAGNVVASRNDRGQWVPILEPASKDVSARMLGTEVTATSEGVRPAMDMTATVGLAGILCGVLSVCCDRQTAARIAVKMLGAHVALGREQVQDAFGEIRNMVAGNLKHKIGGAASDCMLSVPTVISGTDYSVRSGADSEAYEITRRSSAES
jgi:chemotaxis protein CheX